MTKPVLTAKFSGRAVPVASLTDASRAFCAAQLAASKRGRIIRQGEVADASGAVVARISQNGRVWAPGPWAAGAAPLCEAQWGR